MVIKMEKINNNTHKILRGSIVCLHPWLDHMVRAGNEPSFEHFALGLLIYE